MTDTEQSLFDAVLANPDDDLPRLVMADWLDENGDPVRAQYIRDSIDFHNHPHRDAILTKEYDARDGVNDVWMRGFDLYRAIETAWMENGQKWAVESRTGLSATYNLTWSRGFPGELLCDLNDFMLLAPYVGKKWPLTKVKLIDRQPDPIGEEFCWLLMRPGLESYQSRTLPVFLFSLLKGGRYESAGVEWRQATGGAGDVWKVFKTTNDAYNALQDACLVLIETYREVINENLLHPEDVHRGSRTGHHPLQLHS